jgi:hypothetical protein
MIVVGSAPYEWSISLFISFPGIALLTLVTISYYSKSRRLESSLKQLQAEYERQQGNLLSEEKIVSLRSKAKTIVEEFSTGKNTIPKMTSANQLARDLIVFLRTGNIEEHLLFGLGIIDSEQTGDERLDRKLSTFALCQTFEESLVQLGRISEREQVRKRFENAKQLTTSYMLKQLIEDVGKGKKIQEYGRFDRSMGSEDFDNKLRMLIQTGKALNRGDSEIGIEQPFLDYSIALLVRNYTHHTPILDSRLYNEEVVFNLIFEHLIGAVVRSFVQFNPAYSG